MIPLIQTSGGASVATPAADTAAGQRAADPETGFAALMRGNSAAAGSGSGAAGAAKQNAQPQGDAPTPSSESTAKVSEADGATSPTKDPEVKTAEDLLGLLDQTITQLHQGAGQVTPKTVLDGFAAALGDAPVSHVGDLAAVAALEDPGLEATLQGKISGALRLSSGTSQLSVASAAVPAVGRGPMAVATPQGTVAGLAELADPAVTTAPTMAPSLAVAAAAQGAQAGPAVAPGQMQSRAGQTSTGQPIAALSGQISQEGTALGALPTAGATASDAVPGFTALRQAVPPPLQANALRQDGMATGLEASKASTTSPLALGAETMAQSADPRLAGADPFLLGSEAAKPVSGAATGVADAALRDFSSLAAPQAAPSETPRLSPPSTIAAPPPNPAAAPEEQLRQHVTQQIRGLDVSDNKMRFSLSPFGMGEIEIEVIRSENGRMQIAMTTESASVLTVLRQDREQLLDALQARGISADSADLDFQTFDDRGRQNGRGAPSLAEDSIEGAPLTDFTAQGTDTGAAGTPPTPGGPGQLDILT